MSPMVIMMAMNNNEASVKLDWVKTGETPFRLFEMYLTDSTNEWKLGMPKFPTERRYCGVVGRRIDAFVEV